MDVYGTDGLSSEEAIRALFDSLRSVCLATEYKSTMLGGGNFHSHAASTIRMAGEAKAEGKGLQWMHIQGRLN